jgi:integrase
MYLASWLAFCNWCVLSGVRRLKHNPLAGIPKANERADKRRTRRALTTDELVRLFTASRERPLYEGRLVRRGINQGKPLAKLNEGTVRQLSLVGQERELIYRSLVFTGLRLGELASIRVCDLDLNPQKPRFTLHAGSEKSRQGTQITIRRDLADAWRQWIADQVCGPPTSYCVFPIS